MKGGRKGARKRGMEEERAGGMEEGEGWTEVGRAFDSNTLSVDMRCSVTRYDCLPIRGEDAPLLPPKHMYMYLPYAR